MSVSLVALRLEISGDFPLLEHLHFTSSKYLRNLNSAKSGQAQALEGESTAAISSPPNPETEVLSDSETLKKYRGCREPHEIIIETLKEVSDLDIDSFPEFGDMSDIKGKGDLVKQSSKEASPASTADSTKEPSPALSDSSKSGTDWRTRGSVTSQISFYSGNHCVEVTNGILHLYKENQRTAMAEEAERSEMLCILAIPAFMTLRDLLSFTAPANTDIENMQIIRDSKPNQYMALIKFRNQKSADEFYKIFNGTRFNTLDPEVCHIVYVAKVETIKESQESCLPMSGLTELPTCPVCLERMDESVEGILTILCNHSFHTSCLSKWGDTSCPVCRYCQTPEMVPDNRCFGCGSQESLWICLICGHVGCGRYAEGHAYKHYLETQHTYTMQLENNRVWDYAGDNYVHRLIQNKADGKPVELETSHVDVENEEKLDSIQLEYTYLLTSQLEAQRHYFEDRMTRIEKESNRQIDELKEKAKLAVEERKTVEEKLAKIMKEKQSLEKKINNLNTRVAKSTTELKDEAEMNKCLRQNQQSWQQKVKELETKVTEMEATKSKEIKDLKEQVRDLMFYLEAQEKVRTASVETQQELQEGQITIGPSNQASGSTPRHNRKKHR